MQVNGFYCHNVNNLKFRDIQLDYKTDEAHPAFVFDNVNGLRLTDIQAKRPGSGMSSFLFKNVKNLEQEK